MCVRLHQCVLVFMCGYYTYYVINNSPWRERARERERERQGERETKLKGLPIQQGTPGDWGSQKTHTHTHTHHSTGGNGLGEIGNSSGKENGRESRPRAAIEHESMDARARPSDRSAAIVVRMPEQDAAFWGGAASISISPTGARRHRCIEESTGM